jgi:basic membrane protein A and related proteins
MKREKILAAVLTLMLIITSLGGCARRRSGQTPGQTPGQQQIRVGMVTDVGGVNDQSFNQAAWEGLQKAQKELGIKASYQESEKDADYEPNLETLQDAGNQLIWGIGFKMGDAIGDAAQANPDQKYGIIDYSYDPAPENVVGVLFKAEEASFLVGYIAGKMTESNTIGFVGGIDVPVIQSFQYGFMAGVKQANPEAQVRVQFAESFTDAARGKAIATQMYQQGADIVFHAAGAVGDGVIEAAVEQDKKAIGVDRDQNYLAPNNVITSAMKRVDTAVFEITKRMLDNDFPGGQTIVYGLKEGGVGIAPTTEKNVPKEIVEEVKDVERQIIDEEIEVPVNREQYNQFVQTLGQ